MNTARNLTYTNDMEFPAPRLRLVVSNVSQEPAPDPVFKLPCWLDRAGQFFGYLIIGLFVVNIVNQLLLW